ncbi:hypothetical protein ACFLXB_05055 [Chloroflexota bacterium]
MNIRYFRVAGITISFETDLNLEEIPFNPAMLPFAVDTPGDDTVTLQRFFEIPDLDNYDLGNKIYRQLPWAIYENQETGHVYYQGITSIDSVPPFWCFADFYEDYSRGKIYNPPHIKDYIEKNGYHSLTGFPSDSLWLAQLLSDRTAVYMHSSAAILNGKGLLFLGRSEAGKTTTVRMLQRARDGEGASVTILCDEANVARRWNDGWHVHGTWRHGEETEVSASSAPLLGIFILKQDQENLIEPIYDHDMILKTILSTMIRPVMTRDWWLKEISVMEQLIKEIPVYLMSFNKSGDIIPMLEELTLSQQPT